MAATGISLSVIKHCAQIFLLFLLEQNVLKACLGIFLAATGISLSVMKHCAQIFLLFLLEQNVLKACLGIFLALF